jgi:DNA-binding transcriptional LysR family regulator
VVASFGGSLDLPPQQLRTFLTVARRLSYTRAAEELHLTQPAVSIHIRKLERAVGSTLFEHIGRRVILTAAGQAVYGYAERALALEDELRATLADVGGVPRGPFEIGTSTTIGISILPTLVRRFVAANPDVRLHVRVGMGTEVIAEVLDGQLDVALVIGAVDNERLEAESVMDDELVLIVPPDHHWASAQSVGPHDLVGEPMLVTWPGSWNGSFIAQQLGAHGVTLDIVARSNSHPAIARLVEAGVGAGIVSRLSVADELAQGRLVAVVLREVDFRRSVYLVVHRDKHPTPALRAFRELVAELRSPTLA